MNFIEEKGDFVDKKLGVTQDYERSNYDSTKAKKDFKDSVFGDSETITDSYTGEILYKSHKKAKEQYGSEYSKHAVEADHINSLKSVHDKVKKNPFLSDDDVKEIANTKENFRALSKHDNTSKGEKSDFTVISDPDSCFSLKGKIKYAGEKVKSDVFLTGKFTARTAENISGLTVDFAKKSIENNSMQFVRCGVDHIVGVATGEESLEDAVADVGGLVIGTVGKDVAKDVADVTKDAVDTALSNNALYQSLKSSDMFKVRATDSIGGLAVNSAKNSVKNNTMKFVGYGVEHITDVATGEESFEDAVVDVGGLVIETVGKDVIKDVADAALVNNALYQSLKNSGALGQLIQVGTIVAESASRLIDGEITADEFMLEIGDKGATMVAQMIGGEVGAIVGEIIGISAGGLLGAGVGEIIGRAVGTMVATVACNVVIAIRTNIINNLKSLDDYKLKEKAIHKLETEAIAEMEYQRQKFLNIVESEYQKWDENIETGFDMMMSSACQEIYDLQGITDGLDRILSVFGKSVMFKSLDEYELQLDMPLKLSF